MSLQLHRPDDQGGLETRTAKGEDYRGQLRSTRWGAAMKGGKLPALANTEMNPTSTARSVVFWAALGLVTFVVIVAGYSLKIWAL